MFALSEDEVAALRAAFDSDGEFAAAIEVRRLFPAITDNEQALRFARIIAGRQPLRRPAPRRPRRKAKPTDRD